MRTLPPPNTARRSAALACGALVALAACSDGHAADPTGPSSSRREVLVTYEQLTEALKAARAEPNGGFNLDMWATVVDTQGLVVAVTFTGAHIGDQWYNSRVISAQKANTAMGFSLPGLALSSANLYAPTQPGGTLFGLQESNPVNDDVAYRGNFRDFGTSHDPMVGRRIGGINVFGGGLALYNSDGVRVGGVGVSGDASCADHNIAWKVRDRLRLDFVPAGVSPTKDDNIIYDIDPATGKSASGFGHPECSPEATAIGNALPTTNPISKVGSAALVATR
jgi:uncharacterized protein GlcG (DUF336 family)